MKEKILLYLAIIGLCCIIREIYIIIRKKILKYQCNKVDYIITDKDNGNEIKAFVILYDKKEDTEKLHQINKTLIDEYGLRILRNAK